MSRVPASSSMPRRAALAGLSVAVARQIAGCQPEPFPVLRGPDVATDAATSSSADASPRVDGGSTPLCTPASATNTPGCPCPAAGQLVACWTDLPEKRHVGLCHDGMQVCASTGPGAVWSACLGEQTRCTLAELDASVPALGLSDGGREPCACKPGVEIDCRTFVGVSNQCAISVLGKTTCSGDGTWSPCSTSSAAGTSGAGAELDPCVHTLFFCNLVSPVAIFAGDCSAAFSCGRAPDLLSSTQ